MGVIVVSDDSTASFANWAFDHVKRLLKAEIPKDEGRRLLEGIEYDDNSGHGILSFEESTPEEMKTLKEALERVHQALLAAGPQSFNDPSYFAGFVEGFEELLTLVANDPRCSPTP